MEETITYLKRENSGKSILSCHYLGCPVLLYSLNEMISKGEYNLDDYEILAFEPALFGIASQINNQITTLQSYLASTPVFKFHKIITIMSTTVPNFFINHNWAIDNLEKRKFLISSSFRQFQNQTQDQPFLCFYHEKFHEELGRKIAEYIEGETAEILVEEIKPRLENTESERLTENEASEAQSINLN